MACDKRENKRVTHHARHSIPQQVSLALHAAAQAWIDGMLTVGSCAPSPFVAVRQHPCGLTPVYPATMNGVGGGVGGAGSPFDPKYGSAACTGLAHDSSKTWILSIENPCDRPEICKTWDPAPSVYSGFGKLPVLEWLSTRLRHCQMLTPSENTFTQGCPLTRRKQSFDSVESGSLW